MIIKKNEFLHYVSKIGTFMVLYGLLYIVQDLTIGLLPFMNDWFIGEVPMKFLIFSFVSVAVILKFVKIGSPYK
ncbi:hypothetical protein BK131_04685 [Paenibacillus amylolyticus]|uniref:Uncharacterized protein n=1 Tax=Paenibacillus amylolyticus TaxID=1451 RepID=A0A1R1C5A5_PAEAM|nr:hypothetical protein BK131_04685 [Paenibacillus amylolyticus]